MKTAIRTALVVTFVMMLAQPVVGGVRTLMEFEADGSSNSYLLSHPFLSANPDALIAVSQFSWNEVNAPNVYYSGAWYLSNNSVAPIPSGTLFWLLLFDEDSGFRHVTTVDNTSGHITSLDHPRLNGNPNARPIVTRESSSGPAIPLPYGVWYNASWGVWTIFYQDIAADMPINASFSVFIPDESDLTFIHTADGSNISGNYSVLNQPGFDHSRPHQIFATQRWTGVYNDNEIGVSWFLSFLVGNVDGDPMPSGAAFNIYVAPLFEDGFEMGSDVLWTSSVP